MSRASVDCRRFSGQGIALCALHGTLGIATAISITLAFNANAIAQITPDSTLPNNSNVKLDGNTFNITEGTNRGANLFHSFSNFSVPTGSTANFKNAANIQNIINRVTGGSISNIDGFIKAAHSANVFLINPNGIVFGPNARLEVGGSFFATSANSMKFADGFEFSATNPESAPLLTITAPVGLQFGANPGRIQVQGNGQPRRTTAELFDSTAGLQVQPNQTLALVGADISLEGATLKTAGGRIELGSVGDNSFVSLTPINKGFALGYTGVTNFSNILLSQNSAVDASGAGSGVQAIGRQITLSDGSVMVASTLGKEQGGTMVVNAVDLLELIGTTSDRLIPSGLYAQAREDATGNAGDLTINTAQLVVRDGAQVGTSSFSAAKGGNLTVNATDSVQLIGAAADGLFVSSLSASAGSTGDSGNLTINTAQLVVRDGGGLITSTGGAGNAGNLTVTADKIQLIGRSTLIGSSGLFAEASIGSTGDAGNLTINTQQLLVQDGAAVSAGTGGLGYGGDLTINTQQLLVQDGAGVSVATFGAGNGGNLTVTADSIQLIGRRSGNTPTGLSAQTSPGSTGDAGNLTINTQQLLLQNTTARVSAATGGAGNGGDLTINTQQLLVQDGAQVSASTFGAGNGGNLTVTADSIQLIGRSNTASGLYAQASIGSTGDAGNLTINTQHLLVQDRARVSAGTFGGGDGGDLAINTQHLLVQDGADVSVRSFGTGTAGNLTVEAGSIRLDNNAILTADTRSNSTDPNQEQASINLRVRDLILRRGSNITTNAAGENVIGGNINIDTDVLAAVEDSDISANSTDFRGGNVRINAQGIFGTQFRFASTPESDITATGRNDQLNGDVQINTPNEDPGKGLITLIADLVDVARLVDNNVCAATAKSTFIYTGRGGLPPSPNNTLSSDAVWEDWRLTAVPRGGGERGRGRGGENNNSQLHTKIVPAQGWVIDKNGDVTLIAYASTTTPRSVGSSSIGCQSPIVK